LFTISNPIGPKKSYPIFIISVNIRDMGHSHVAFNVGFFRSPTAWHDSQEEQVNLIRLKATINNLQIKRVTKNKKTKKIAIDISPPLTQVHDSY